MWRTTRSVDQGSPRQAVPLLEELWPFWDLLQDRKEKGLLFERWAVAAARDGAPLRAAALPELIAAYRSRCNTNTKTATERVRVRNGVLRDADGLDYDQIQREFKELANGGRPRHDEGSPSPVRHDAQ